MDQMAHLMKVKGLGLLNPGQWARSAIHPNPPALGNSSYCFAAPSLESSPDLDVGTLWAVVSMAMS